LKRGDLFRVKHPTGDPKRSRVFVVVSRDILQRTSFPTVVCAPVLTARHGLATEVDVGPDEGLKQASSIHCDALVSLPKSSLSNWVGALSRRRLEKLARALRIALSAECEGDDRASQSGVD